MRRQVSATDRSDHVKGRLKMLARLTIASGKKLLSEVLMPEQCETMQALVNEKFEPGVRIKMGQYMRQAMESLNNIGIKNDDNCIQTAMARSMKLHDSEWKHAVYHPAALLAERETFNTQRLLPISQDIAKVRNHLDSQVLKCVDDYKANKADAFYCKSILAMKAGVYNKRRGSEFINCKRTEMENCSKSS